MRSTLSSGVCGATSSSASLLRVRRDGTDLFFGPHHAHAEFEFEHGVRRAVVAGHLLGGQALEGVRRATTGLPGWWACRRRKARAAPAPPGRRNAAPARAPLRPARARACTRARPRCAGPSLSLVAAVGHELEEAVAHLLLGMGGHVGALALPAHHQVFRRQFVDGLAHGALADAKARRQVHLAGNGFARLPFAGLQALQDQRLDLLVQRAERRRRLWRGVGRGQGVVGRGGRVGHRCRRLFVGVRSQAGKGARNCWNHILYKT